MMEATSCGGVVIFRGKILLLYKNYKNKYEGWVLPKGTVEQGEDYKDTALRFFKSFKTSVEMSNKGYIFNDRNVQGLVGKYLGVVLGEEEYWKNNGDTGTRLYVAQVRSCKAIQDGDFKVPELKKLAGQAPRAVQPARTVPVGFSDIRDDDDGEIPF